mmetsp:Transcript_6676/g.11922  ORF Transcript_6676/g.11922 Transcript_6676/m.11922 type:complete len:92 (-) Transcript_6676:866-1141(-)
MGGGGRYQYPKEVWTPSGGWWPNPRHWRRNSMIGLVVIGIICIPLYIYDETYAEITPPAGKMPHYPHILTRDEVYALYDARMAAEAQSKQK